MRPPSIRCSKKLYPLLSILCVCLDSASAFTSRPRPIVGGRLGGQLIRPPISVGCNGPPSRRPRNAVAGSLHVAADDGEPIAPSVSLNGNNHAGTTGEIGDSAVVQESSTTPDGHSSEPLFEGIGRGVVRDYRMRLPFFKSDISDGLNGQVSLLRALQATAPMLCEPSGLCSLLLYRSFCVFFGGGGSSW